MGQGLHRRLHAEAEGHAMTFTELEYLLMLAVAVLLWRNARLDAAKEEAVDAANKYAYFLQMIGMGKGTVVSHEKGFRFEEKR